MKDQWTNFMCPRCGCDIDDDHKAYVKIGPNHQVVVCEDCAHTPLQPVAHREFKHPLEQRFELGPRRFTKPI